MFIRANLPIPPSMATFLPQPRFFGCSEWLFCIWSSFCLQIDDDYWLRSDPEVSITDLWGKQCAQFFLTRQVWFTINKVYMHLHINNTQLTHTPGPRQGQFIMCKVRSVMVLQAMLSSTSLIMKPLLHNLLFFLAANEDWTQENDIFQEDSITSDASLAQTQPSLRGSLSEPDKNQAVGCSGWYQGHFSPLHLECKVCS